MKHRHYELICQWAADPSKKVEFRRENGTWGSPGPAPMWDENVEYRFADKVLKYRVALFDTGAQRWTSTTGDPTTAANLEGTWPFVRWLTDWTEVTDPPVEKQKPRLKYEVWLVLTPTGQRIVFDDEPNANAYATRHSSEVRHIKWEVPA